LLLGELRALVTAAEAESYAPLPTALSRGETFHDALHSLVYDMLMIKVRCPDADPDAVRERNGQGGLQEARSRCCARKSQTMLFVKKSR
jgi:hypothetical protein